MKVVKLRTTKYMAGDLVSQAKPKINPRIRLKSKRGFLANLRDKYNDRIPKNESKLSAVARRSKKKVKGKKI